MGWPVQPIGQWIFMLPAIGVGRRRSHCYYYCCCCCCCCCYCCRCYYYYGCCCCYCYCLYFGYFSLYFTRAFLVFYDNLPFVGSNGIFSSPRRPHNTQAIYQPYWVVIVWSNMVFFFFTSSHLQYHIYFYFCIFNSWLGFWELWSVGWWVGGQLLFMLWDSHRSPDAPVFVRMPERICIAKHTAQKAII